MGAGRFYEIITDSEGNFEITELDRIMKEFEICKDIQRCMNIILDLHTVMKEDLSERKKEEKSARAIEYGLVKIFLKENFESTNYVLCDMYGCVLSHFIQGLKIKEEMIIEGKRKIIINNIIDNGTELVKEKGIETVIEYGSDSSSNESKMMFDRIIEMMIEKIKNEITTVADKKNIIILLDNIINNGIELKEEKEVLNVISILREEGRKMIAVEGISEVEKKEWKELKNLTVLLESDILNKRKGKEEMMKSVLMTKKEKEKEKEKMCVSKEDTGKLDKKSVEIENKNNTINEKEEESKKGIDEFTEADGELANKLFCFMLKLVNVEGERKKLEIEKEETNKKIKEIEKEIETEKDLKKVNMKMKEIEKLKEKLKESGERTDFLIKRYDEIIAKGKEIDMKFGNRKKEKGVIREKTG